MRKALSMDLRERDVRHVLNGNSRRQAAGAFAISVSSAIRFLARHAATGSVAPKQGRRGRRSTLEPHREFLVSRIAEAPDITMPDLAAELAERGTKIDPSNLSRWFIKNGYRFKKNAAGQRARSARRQTSPRGVAERSSAKDAA